MAIAEILKKEVQKIEVVQRGVSLHLSNLEAYVLVNYLYGAGGNLKIDDQDDCRKIINNIRMSLEDKEFKPENALDSWPDLFTGTPVTRALYFTSKALKIIKAKLQKLGLE